MLETADIQTVTTIENERYKIRRPYPELFAKTHNRTPAVEPAIKLPGRDQFSASFKFHKELFETILNNGARLSCTAGYIAGHCARGHKFVKAVFCGREWCPSCGQDGSPAHLRRIARWMPKISQMPQVGYFVITIPEVARPWFTKPEQLTDFRTFIKRKLQRDGYGRGLIRWHLFGDCKSCNGKGCRFCEYTGAGTKYHPHLNILVEGGKIKKADFAQYFPAFRKSLSAYFKRVTGLDDLPGVVNYQYTNEAGKKMHLMKYITRSTHRIFNKEIAENLKGYRITSSWGKWSKVTEQPRGEYSDLISIENNICPCCAEAITWDVGYWKQDAAGKQVYKRKLQKFTIRGPGERAEHIKAGYYIIHEIEKSQQI